MRALARAVLSVTFLWSVGIAGTGAAVASAEPAHGQATPEFRLGFKAIADQIPDVVGYPLEEEQWGPDGGSTQLTSTGLMAWRASDNRTAFTDGARTWVNGPRGLQVGGNDERFPWEGPPAGRASAVSSESDERPTPLDPDELALVGTLDERISAGCISGITLSDVSVLSTGTGLSADRLPDLGRVFVLESLDPGCQTSPGLGAAGTSDLGSGARIEVRGALVRDVRGLALWSAGGYVWDLTYLSGGSPRSPSAIVSICLSAFHYSRASSGAPCDS